MVFSFEMAFSKTTLTSVSAIISKLVPVSVMEPVALKVEV